jgi:hypothetical protein
MTSADAAPPATMTTYSFKTTFIAQGRQHCAVAETEDAQLEFSGAVEETAGRERPADRSFLAGHSRGKV